MLGNISQLRSAFPRQLRPRNETHGLRPSALFLCNVGLSLLQRPCWLALLCGVDASIGEKQRAAGGSPLEYHEHCDTLALRRLCAPSGLALRRAATEVFSIRSKD
jgi:hypothetical protein